MSDYTISIPNTLYEKAQRLAQQISQPVDDVIRTRLEGAWTSAFLTCQAMKYLTERGYKVQLDDMKAADE